MNRKDKLLMLQGLLSGKIPLDELAPKKHTMRIGYPLNVAAWLINGKPVQEEQFTESIKRNPPEAFTITYKDIKEIN